MAKDQEVDETAQPVEEVEEDFDGEDDLDDDLEIIDDEDDAEPEEEEAKPPKRKVSDADLTESNYEQAVRANPKRATAIKKSASLIEGGRAHCLREFGLGKTERGGRHEVAQEILAQRLLCCERSGQTLEVWDRVREPGSLGDQGRDRVQGWREAHGLQ